jgi:hypothetical protein
MGDVKAILERRREHLNHEIEWKRLKLELIGLPDWEQLNLEVEVEEYLRVRKIIKKLEQEGAEDEQQQVA